MNTIMESIPEIDRKAKGISITPEKIARMIDNTELSPGETEDSLKSFCDEARSYQFHSVSVNPYYTRFCADHLEGENIQVDTAVGFPLGQTTPEEKAFETKRAIEDGASEIDVVMNIAAFRDEKRDFVERDIEAVVDAANGNLVKVIIETGYLTYEEVIEASKLVKDSGADFVKNSTGFGPYGANIPHILLMREAVGENFGVKAAGGIRDFRDALRMIAAGANRIGTSAGTDIIDGFKRADHRSWTTEEPPCDLCPSQKVAPADVPSSVYQYYKSKCVGCPYKRKDR